MSKLTAGVTAPAALTVLRDKIARGERITQDEALAACELERWLTYRCNQVADEALLRAREEAADALG